MGRGVDEGGKRGWEGGRKGVEGGKKGVDEGVVKEVGRGYADGWNVK